MFTEKSCWNKSCKLLSWQHLFEVSLFRFVLFRSSHPRCSVKKVFSEISQNSQENTCARLFFNKVAGLSLCRRCFPMNFVKFLRTPFLQNTSGRLLQLVSALQYFEYYYDEYPLKQTASLYFSSFKSAFLACFYYFWKVKSLFISNLFIIYLYQDKILPWKKKGVGIFSKAPDWISLFLFKIKIKQNPNCPNKEYNAIFEHIH